MNNIERLEREIRALRGSLGADIASRRDHPTYGVTKTGMRTKLARLIGMLEAWLYVTGRWEDGGLVMWVSRTYDIVADDLGIRVDILETEVNV